MFTLIVVLTTGCSTNRLFKNGKVTPTEGSEYLFTVTCLPGYITSNGSCSQYTSCTNGAWTDVLSCQRGNVM